MARSRLLKPGFYKNEDLAQCTPHARLCFAGLWLLADREGRLEDRPLRIKAELFPYEILDLDAILSELAQHGFIVRYQADSGRFIAVLKFQQHQMPHVRETASLIPAPTLVMSSTDLALTLAVSSTSLGEAVDVPRTPCIDPVSVSVSVSDPVTDPVSVSKTVPKTVPKTGAVLAAARPVNGNGHFSARSNRIVYEGQRLVIREFMLDDCMKTLGPMTDAFDLELWFQDLDRHAMEASIVIPKKNADWLQAQLLEEAKRRNLPIAVTDAPRKLGRVGVIAQAVADIQREERQR